MSGSRSSGQRETRKGAVPMARLRYFRGRLLFAFCAFCFFLSCKLRGDIFGCLLVFSLEVGGKKEKAPISNSALEFRGGPGEMEEGGKSRALNQHVNQRRKAMMRKRKKRKRHTDF
jgi:hypothetical protein